jgi:hypothetical protein
MASWKIKWSNDAPIWSKLRNISQDRLLGLSQFVAGSLGIEIKNIQSKRLCSRGT